LITSRCFTTADGLIHIWATSVPMNMRAFGNRCHWQHNSFRCVLFCPTTTVKIDPRLAGAVFITVKQGLPLFRHVAGVGVQSVQQGSPAWQAGLRKDDVITAVNRKRVTSPQELAQAARENPDVLVLNLERGDVALLLVIR